MINKIIEKHKDNKNYISILQSIQDEYGYIPQDETMQVAKTLEVPFVKLWGVATFYTQFKLQKRGKYVIQVCNGTACHVNNSSEIVEALKDLLQIEEGETTEDGIFTLELVNCIGACAQAPAVMINDEVYGQLDVKKVKKIISDCRDK